MGNGEIPFPALNPNSTEQKVTHNEDRVVTDSLSTPEITRQAVYVYSIRNTEVRSGDHCCRGKATSITYSGCVSVALVVNRAKRMRYIILSYDFRGDRKSVV